MALFVGRLPRDMRTRELEDIFYKYGRIVRCEVKRNGYGFVEYEDQRDAEDALKACDGMRYAGERIVVEWSKGARRSSEECFKCGRVGHWARSCPSSGGAGGAGGRGRDERGGDRYSRGGDRDRDGGRDGGRVERRGRSRSRSRSPRSRSRSPISRRSPSPVRRSRSPPSRRHSDEAVAVAAASGDVHMSKETSPRRSVSPTRD